MANYEKFKDNPDALKKYHGGIMDLLERDMIERVVDPKFASGSCTTCPIKACIRPTRRNCGLSSMALLDLGKENCP